MGMTVLKGSLSFASWHLYTLYHDSVCDKSGKTAMFKFPLNCLTSNLYFFFFLCVSCSGFQKKPKKFFYMLQSLSALKLFKAIIGVNEEICSFSDESVCLLSITNLYWAQIIHHTHMWTHRHTYGQTCTWRHTHRDTFPWRIKSLNMNSPIPSGNGQVLWNGGYS